MPNKLPRKRRDDDDYRIRCGIVRHSALWLATSLGHVHINETYWYLEAVPELLQLATDRLVNNGKEARR
jgi:hypothetical protein